MHAFTTIVRFFVVFAVLTVEKMQGKVFRDVKKCNRVNIFFVFRGNVFSVLNMKKVHSWEPLTNCYQNNAVTF